jgi:ABC-type transporter Mla subunit MlaD
MPNEEKPQTYPSPSTFSPILIGVDLSLILSAIQSLEEKLMANFTITTEQIDQLTANVAEVKATLQAEATQISAALQLVIDGLAQPSVDLSAVTAELQSIKVATDALSELVALPAPVVVPEPPVEPPVEPVPTV